MSDICVVHLVRKKNGLEPFRRFLASYLGNPAGVDHDLLILYKGFYRKADITPYEVALKNIPHSFLMVADFGFDLRPYFAAAEKYDSKYFCFLNSFSVILDKDWLLKLYRHISRPGVGLVGATGSYGSWASHNPQEKLFSLPPFIPRKKERPLHRRIILALPLGIFAVRLALRMRTIPSWVFSHHFSHFPSYHIRTNGFMIARDTMLRIRRGVILTKKQTYILESGKRSITKQIESMGLKLVVVGKDGKGYDKLEWDISDTFWRGTQANLLISDNQTRGYDKADMALKKTLCTGAWGSNQ